MEEPRVQQLYKEIYGSLAIQREEKQYLNVMGEVKDEDVNLKNQSGFDKLEEMDESPTKIQKDQLMKKQNKAKKKKVENPNKQLVDESS